MSAAWTVSDQTLYQFLTAYLASLNVASWWTIDVFVNDWIPQPGDTRSDYETPTTAQWPGYLGVQLPATAWQKVQVSESVAQSYQPTPAEWVYPEGISVSRIYGYLLTDGFGNLVMSERFETPVTPNYPATLQIQVYLNLGIQPDTISTSLGLSNQSDDIDEDEESGE